MNEYKLKELTDEQLRNGRKALSQAIDILDKCEDLKDVSPSYWLKETYRDMSVETCRRMEEDDRKREIRFDDID